MTYSTLFSGVEGWGQGLEQAGLQPLWGCETDKWCRKVLKRHYPSIPIYEDVKTLDASSLDVAVPDVLVISPPCQDLSMAGNRKGLAGARSGLFFDAIRIANQLVQRGTELVIMEQVTGLLSSHKSEDFRKVLQAFLEIGAIDLGWRVLDSQWFGVPQRRRRLYVVADFRAERAGEILSLAEGLSGAPRPVKEAGQTAPTLFGSGAGTSRTASAGSETEFVVVEEVAKCLTGKSTRLDASVESFVIEPIPLKEVRANTWKGDCGPGIGEPGDPSYCLPATASLMHGVFEQPIAFPSRGINDPGECGLAMARATNPPAVVGYGRPRRFTPMETERLQGMSDLWTKETAEGKVVPDLQRYKMTGNAVSVPVARWIGTNLMRIS